MFSQLSKKKNAAFPTPRQNDNQKGGEKPGFDTRPFYVGCSSPTEGPDDVQRCNDGTIINRWHRHAYANHPLDLGTQHLLTATMPPFAGIRCAQLDLRSRPARTNR